MLFAAERTILPRYKKELNPMLCLSLLPGEYLTIGENVVVQLDAMTGNRCRFVINAPREIPVMRGALREREGGERPDCVFDKPRWYKRELPWDRSKAQALAAMRRVLDGMDGGDENVRDLRRQLNHIFPPSEKKE